MTFWVQKHGLVDITALVSSPTPPEQQVWLMLNVSGVATKDRRYLCLYTFINRPVLFIIGLYLALFYVQYVVFVKWSSSLVVVKLTCVTSYMLLKVTKFTTSSCCNSLTDRAVPPDPKQTTGARSSISGSDVTTHLVRSIHNIVLVTTSNMNTN